MSGRMQPPLRRLCAREQLLLLREYPRLVPRLLGWGLSAGDALALAHNATLLYQVVEADPPFRAAADVLDAYSLEEIARLCETYRQVEAGELEYGGREGTA